MCECLGSNAVAVPCAVGQTSPRVMSMSSSLGHPAFILHSTLFTFPRASLSRRPAFLGEFRAGPRCLLSTYCRLAEALAQGGNGRWTTAGHRGSTQVPKSQGKDPVPLAQTRRNGRNRAQHKWLVHKLHNTVVLMSDTGGDGLACLFQVRPATLAGGY